MKKKEILQELDELHDVLAAGTERFKRDLERYDALEARVRVLEQNSNNSIPLNWGTAVDKLKELESKVDSVNGHQNRSDQYVRQIQPELAEYKNKLSNAKSRLTALEKAVFPTKAKTKAPKSS